MDAVEAPSTDQLTIFFTYIVLFIYFIIIIFLEKEIVQ